jgi:hypothetical protein
MTIELDEKTVAKICKLLPRLASDHDGEVIATVAAIRRTLGSVGGSLHELAALVRREPEIVERVVYRERIVEKIVEKVVYRDQSATREPSRFDISRLAVLDVGARLLQHEDMRDKERSFISNMIAIARIGDAAFSMTPAQQIWFRDIAARNGFSIPTGEEC